MRVVATGVFDIIHAGHAHFLNAAKEHGDELVVIVANDDTVRKMKGEPILSAEMRAEVPSVLKTQNEEKFCQDVTLRRKMREEFDKTLGKVRFVNVERENISQIVMYAKTKSLFVTVEPEISINDKTKIISQIKKLTSNLK
jgi:cytidyltransferase-like protein